MAKRAEAYLKASGLGDTAFFGPEPEFFVFDGDPLGQRHVRQLLRRSKPNEGAWNTGTKYEARQQWLPSDRQGWLLPCASR
jgi:glutamine synthetase